MWVAQNGSAQRVTGSLVSIVSARTPPWLRELLSVRGLTAAIAARPPAPPRPVGRPRLERPAPSFIKEKPVVWVQLLHSRLPSHQVHVSLRLHFSGRAAAEAEKAAEWDKQQRVWLRLEVGGKMHVQVQLRASPFPTLKQWSEWEREFALSMADRFGRLGLAEECS